MATFGDTLITATRLGSSTELASISGRAVLWRTLWPLVTENLVLGHGYGAFWTPDVMRRAAETLALVASGHSMYFDELGALGVVGLILMCWVLLQVWRTAWRRRAEMPALSSLVMGLTAFTVVVGYAESIWQRPHLPPVLPLLVGAFFIAIHDVNSQTP